MKLRCLLIDDEPPALKVLASYISNINGLEIVAQCKNAIEALDILHQKPVDVIFLDIKMPEMNGFELLRKIRKEDENLRICFLTAMSELKDHMSDINELSPAFVKDWVIRKPISNKDLLNDINRILSSS